MEGAGLVAKAEEEDCTNASWTTSSPLSISPNCPPFDKPDGDDANMTIPNSELSTEDRSTSDRSLRDLLALSSGLSSQQQRTDDSGGKGGDAEIQPGMLPTQRHSENGYTSENSEKMDGLISSTVETSANAIERQIGAMCLETTVSLDCNGDNDGVLASRKGFSAQSASSQIEDAQQRESALISQEKRLQGERAEPVLLQSISTSSVNTAAKPLTTASTWWPSQEQLEPEPLPPRELPVPSVVVQHETDALGQDQSHKIFERQPSTIAEENSVTQDDDDLSSLHHQRLAGSTAITHISVPLVGVDNNFSNHSNNGCLSESDDNEQETDRWEENETVPSLTQSSPSLDELMHQSTQRTVNPDGSGSARSSPIRVPLKRSSERRDGSNAQESKGHFTPLFASTVFHGRLSQLLLKQHYAPFAAATWIGFWAMLHVTCSNHVLTPMRDAIALQIGVEHIPKLTLASTVLAFCSSVPIGWLFEAPDPSRRRVWKRMGLTRGETQGSSLALFYRLFALVLILYAGGFECVELIRSLAGTNTHTTTIAAAEKGRLLSMVVQVKDAIPSYLFQTVGQILYVAFFLIVHLMKLHSISLMWGVTTEAMEYEEVARRKNSVHQDKTRLQRLSLVSFGGTIGGIFGSFFTSTFARMLRLSGLLVISSILLEISAELSIELGRVMKKHWEEQQLFQSNNDLASLDASMKRSASMGSMKRVASGNSLSRVRSATDLASTKSNSSSSSLESEEVDDNTFVQRLMRGAKTILRSRLLMAIFTYNSLYASTTVLLSFQRAELVANRNAGDSNVQADTAFLANINMASSMAIFALQATGAGAYVANFCGPRGTLALMPMARLVGVLSLAWWHRVSNGRPPNLLLFLILDEFCKIMNMAVAKPVRESLWRGLSNEARYEAKPIVDTLANRWGGGSAAFLVSFIHKTLDLFGVVEVDGVRTVLGFPPTVFLCTTVAAWWAVVSADLGHIRHSIDLELKKRQ